MLKELVGGPAVATRSYIDYWPSPRSEQNQTDQLRGINPSVRPLARFKRSAERDLEGGMEESRQFMSWSRALVHFLQTHALAIALGSSLWCLALFIWVDLRDMSGL